MLEPFERMPGFAGDALPLSDASALQKLHPVGRALDQLEGQISHGAAWAQSPGRHQDFGFRIDSRARRRHKAGDVPGQRPRIRSTNTRASLTLVRISKPGRHNVGRHAGSG
jgi:hypothetical protein